MSLRIHGNTTINIMENAINDINKIIICITVLEYITFPRLILTHIRASFPYARSIVRFA
jgi:hypothetical protein